MHTFPKHLIIYFKDSKFLVIGKITVKYNTIAELYHRFFLKMLAIFWILSLCKLYPDGSNQELNDA